MRAPDRNPPGRNLLVGLLRVARFRADGLAAFEGTVPAFLNSLLPLLAFAVAQAIWTLLRGSAAAAPEDLLMSIVVLLGPLVISEQLARLWRADAGWLKFGVVLNWCQWTLPVVLFLCLILAGILIETGWSDEAAVFVAACLVLAYGVSLHWFLARRALGLSRPRAGAMVLAMNLGTGLLAFGPRLVQMALDGAPAASLSGGTGL